MIYCNRTMQVIEIFAGNLLTIMTNFRCIFSEGLNGVLQYIYNCNIAYNKFIRIKLKTNAPKFQGMTF